jgi:hypothetical protein
VTFTIDLPLFYPLKPTAAVIVANHQEAGPSLLKTSSKLLICFEIRIFAAQIIAPSVDLLELKNGTVVRVSSTLKLLSRDRLYEEAL